jgi:hypothetical protein
MPCKIIQSPSEGLREKRSEREAEERKQRMRESQRREREAIESRRLASLEQQWEWFKAGMQQAQRAQQQQAALRYRQQLMDEIGALIRPRQPLEPMVIYVEEGTGRLGYSDFDPSLMARPLSWW